MITHFVLALVTSLQLAASLGQVPVRGVVTDPSGAVVWGATASVQPSSINGTDTANGTQVWKSISRADGVFSFTLSAGRYHLCVTAFGFQTSCKDFSVGDEPFVALNLTLRVNPITNLAASSVMDNRLRELAGGRAVDCGHVRVGGSPAQATACALHQFQSGQPFRVRYDVQGIDSDVAIGLVSNAHTLYTVAFDSYGLSPRGMPDGSKSMDDNHNVVLTCPLPPKLRVTSTGKVTCLGSGNKALALLGPSF